MTTPQSPVRFEVDATTDVHGEDRTTVIGRVRPGTTYQGRRADDGWLIVDAPDGSPGFLRPESVRLVDGLDPPAPPPTASSAAPPPPPPTTPAPPPPPAAARSDEALRGPAPYPPPATQPPTIGSSTAPAAVRMASAVLVGWAALAVLRVALAFQWGGWRPTGDPLGVSGDVNAWDLFSSPLLSFGFWSSDYEVLYRPAALSPLLWLTVAVGVLALLTWFRPDRFHRIAGVLALVHVGVGVALNIDADVDQLTIVVIQGLVPAACAWLLLRSPSSPSSADPGSTPTSPIG